MEVQVGPAVVVIHAGDEVVVCDPDGRMSATKTQGYFASDTRLVSGYRLKLGRVPPVLLNSSANRTVLLPVRVHEPSTPGRGRRGSPLERPSPPRPHGGSRGPRGLRARQLRPAAPRDRPRDQRRV